MGLQASRTRDQYCEETCGDWVRGAPSSLPWPFWLLSVRGYFSPAQSRLHFLRQVASEASEIGTYLSLAAKVFYCDLPSPVADTYPVACLTCNSEEVYPLGIPGYNESIHCSTCHRLVAETRLQPELLHPVDFVKLPTDDRRSLQSFQANSQAVADLYVSSQWLTSHGWQCMQSIN